MAEEDSFEVPADSGAARDEGAPAPAAAPAGEAQSGGHAAPAAATMAAAPPPTVDPFDPRFQQAMLASLEPPVLQVGMSVGSSVHEAFHAFCQQKGGRVCAEAHAAL